MATDILLQYKRVGESYDGTFFVNNAVDLPFKGESFAQMMTTLHRYLLVHLAVNVQLQRAESAKFMPIYMEPAMVELLRTDPAKYIQVHTIPHRTVDLRKSNRTSKLADTYVAPAPAMRAGHDTLAAAFGDVVYLNWRNHRVENPLTGRWCLIGELADSGLIPLGVINQGTLGWVTVSIEQLLTLDSGNAGYYLPRDWNERGPWISKQALYTKYEQYKKDKAQCLAAVTPETP